MVMMSVLMWDINLMKTYELAMHLVLSFVAIALLVILYRGFRNDCVIYQNGKDFLRTLMFVIIMAAPYLLDASWIKDNSIEYFVTWILTPLFTLIFIVLVIDSFYLSITNNQNAYYVESLIAVFRVFYLLLAALLILNYSIMFKNTGHTAQLFFILL